MVESEENEDNKEENIITIFSGSASSTGWKQAVSVNTDKQNGSAKVSDMNSGDYIYVEYTGNAGELIFQSWAVGEKWIKIDPSETGNAGNGLSYAKYNYSDIVSQYGSDFSTVDMVHIGDCGSEITVKKVQIVK